jgi:MFS family permease
VPSTTSCAPAAITDRVRALLCLAMLLEGLSASSINVQIAAIDADLEPSAAWLSVAVTAFLVAYAGLLPLAGRLVDAGDARRVFRTGIVLFGVAGLVCAAAPTIEVVAAGRFVQGVGAALATPSALSLVTRGLPAGAERNRWVARFGAMGAVGFSAGLVVPGLVTAWWGWRAAFLLLLPVVAVVAVASRRAPSERGLRPSSGADARGGLVRTVAGTLALMTAVAALAPAGDPDAGRAAVAVLGGVAVVAGATWAVGGRAGGGPMLPPQPAVRTAMAVLGLVFAGVLSSILVLGMTIGDHGHDAAVIGLLILPQPVLFSILSSVGARATGRFGSGVVIGVGALCIVASLVLLAVAGSDRPAVVIASMAGIGTGLACCYPAASISAVDAAPEEQRGSVVSALTVCQNVGGAVGVAVVAALGLLPGQGAPPAAAMVASAAMVALVPVALVFRRHPLGVGRAVSAR